jgi:ribose transport system substrate-binding protein
MSGHNGRSTQDTQIPDGLSRRKFLTFGAGAVAGAALLRSDLLKDAGALRANSTGLLKASTAKPLSKTLKLLDSTLSPDNAWYGSYVTGTKYAAQALNATIAVAVPSSDANQLSQMQTAKTKGIMGVSQIANDDGVMPELVRTLASEKIYCAEMWNTAPWFTPLDVGDYYNVFAVVSGINTFRGVAELVFQKMGGKGKVLQIDGIPGASINTQRLEGVAAAAKKYPGIHIVETMAGDWTTEGARPVIDAMLSAHPDVEGIISHNDAMMVSIVDALRQRGYKPGQVVLGSGDGIPEGLQLVMNGWVYCDLCTNPIWLGAWLTARLFDATNGYVPTVGERMMKWGSIIVNTPAAAKAYMDTMYTHKPHYDWQKMSRVLNPDGWDPQNLITPWDPRSFFETFHQAPPKGYSLPKVYTGSAWAKTMAAETALYKAHYNQSKDVVYAIRKLCTGPIATHVVV